MMFSSRRTKYCASLLIVFVVLINAVCLEAWGSSGVYGSSVRSSSGKISSSGQFSGGRYGGGVSKSSPTPVYHPPRTRTPTVSHTVRNPIPYTPYTPGPTNRRIASNIPKSSDGGWRLRGGSTITDRRVVSNIPKSSDGGWRPRGGSTITDRSIASNIPKSSDGGWKPRPGSTANDHKQQTSPYQSSAPVYGSATRVNVGRSTTNGKVASAIAKLSDGGWKPRPGSTANDHKQQTSPYQPSAPVYGSATRVNVGRTTTNGKVASAIAKLSDGGWKPRPGSTANDHKQQTSPYQPSAPVYGPATRVNVGGSTTNGKVASAIAKLSDGGWKPRPGSTANEHKQQASPYQTSGPVHDSATRVTIVGSQNQPNPRGTTGSAYPSWANPSANRHEPFPSNPHSVSHRSAPDNPWNPNSGKPPGPITSAPYPPIHPPGPISHQAIIPSHHSPLNQDVQHEMPMPHQPPYPNSPHGVPPPYQPPPPYPGGHPQEMPMPNAPHIGFGNGAHSSGSLQPIGSPHHYPPVGNSPMQPHGGEYPQSTAINNHYHSPAPPIGSPQNPVGHPMYVDQPVYGGAPAGQPFVPGQTVIGLPNQYPQSSGRGLGQILKEALVYSTVNAGVNRLLNGAAHHHDTHQPPPSTTTNTVIYNQYGSPVPNPNGAPVQGIPQPGQPGSPPTFPTGQPMGNTSVPAGSGGVNPPAGNPGTGTPRSDFPTPGVQYLRPEAAGTGSALQGTNLPATNIQQTGSPQPNAATSNGTSYQTTPAAYSAQEFQNFISNYELRNLTEKLFADVPAGKGEVNPPAGNPGTGTSSFGFPTPGVQYLRPEAAGTWSAPQGTNLPATNIQQTGSPQPNATTSNGISDQIAPAAYPAQEFQNFISNYELGNMTEKLFTDVPAGKGEVKPPEGNPGTRTPSSGIPTPGLQYPSPEAAGTGDAPQGTNLPATNIQQTGSPQSNAATSNRISDQIAPAAYPAQEFQYFISNDELENLTEELFAKGEMDASNYITLNLQRRSLDPDGTEPADGPLFYVLPDTYSIPTIEALRSLFDNYEFDSEQKEFAGPEKREEENAMLDVFLKTDIMTTAMQWLADKGYVDSDEFEWKDTLRRIWMSKMNGATSGFERIFLAERYPGPNILGAQNWIYFDDQTTRERISYLGYVDKISIGDKASLVKVNFKIDEAVKTNTTMLVGTPPELEMALYTICYYARPNDLCSVSLGGTRFTVYTHTFRDFGKDLIDLGFIFF